MEIILKTEEKIVRIEMQLSDLALERAVLSLFKKMSGSRLTQVFPLTENSAEILLFEVVKNSIELFDLVFPFF